MAGEHISSDGVLLENNAFYISTVSIIGTANKDGGTYVAPIASIGSFVFIGGDAAISKKYIASQNVGVAVHAIFKTGSSGNQKLAITRVEPTAACAIWLNQNASSITYICAANRYIRSIDSHKCLANWLFHNIKSKVKLY